MTTLWSFNYIAAKVALREFPALLATAIRMCMAGLTMLPIYAVYRRRGLAGFARADVPILLFLGVIGIGLNQMFFVVGIGRTSVAHAAIMIGLTPMLVLLLAWWAGQERLRVPKLAGLAVAISGVILIQVSSRADRSSSLTGDLLVFVASILFAIFSVTSKRMTGRLNGITLNTFAYVGSGFAVLPILLAQGPAFQFAKVSWLSWLSVFYMAAFSSVLCYVIFYYVLTYIPASRVTAFSYLQPLLATLMAIPLLGEHPTVSLAAGGALVLAGVLLAERA